MAPGSAGGPVSHPVVLVTGASRGLGRAIACHCAAAGCSVLVHYGSNSAAAQETLDLCQAKAVSRGQQFVSLGANLGDAAERQGLFERSLEACGRVDALINNAGMAPRVRADITQATEASFDEVLSVNLKGPYFLSQLAARYWLEQPGKSRLPGGYKLLFVSSVSANTASPNRGEYCLSKAALAMAAQLWAVRLASAGVQVYELRPGIMETDMTAGVKEKYDQLIAQGLVPQMRWGTPDDVGLAAAALLRGHFPFSTGAIVPVDGGLHLRRL